MQLYDHFRQIQIKLRGVFLRRLAVCSPLIVGLIVAAQPGFGQQPANSLGQEPMGVVKGKVIEQSTKRPVQGASILIRDGGPALSKMKMDSGTAPARGATLRGVSTDSSGIFIIRNVPEGNYSLIISFVGDREKTIHDVVVVRNKTFYLETELAGNSDTLSEVMVKSFKHEYTPLSPVSSYSFDREEIFRIPGSQGDIFRAIGILPGVSSSGGQFSAISVRGQGTSDNVYMVDDIPLFAVSHLEGNGAFNDPNGGRFSIFAPRTIDNAQFQGGGFPAQYGRKSSSYLGLGIKEGNTESPSLTGQFDLLGFTLIYDGPSYFSKNTGVFATARYQNFSLLEKVVGLKGIGLPAYGDYMIKTTSQLNPKNKLSILAMFNPEQFVKTVDDIKQLEPIQGTGIVNTSTDKALFSLNLRTLTGEKSYWKNIVWYRSFSARATSGNTSPHIDAAGDFISKDSIPYEADLQKVKDNQREWGYRSIFTQNFHSSSLTSGFDLSRISLEYSRDLKHTDTIYSFAPTDFRPDPSQYYLLLQPAQFNSIYRDFAVNASAYTDLSFKILSRLRLNLGLRFDHTGFTSENTIAPRLSGSMPVGGQSSINFATGIFYQDPEYDDIGDQGPDHRLKNERTIQYILGYKNYFSQDLKLIAETWYKQFTDLVVRPQSDQSNLTNAGTGYAYGLDLSVTRRLSEKYYGQVSYSYMVSKRDDHNGQGQYNFAFSQPHIFSVLASYKPNDKWVISTKFRYATGRPKNNYIIHPDIFNSPGFLRYSQEIIGNNADRLSDFISWDLRVDYHVQCRKLSMTAFVDIVDVLNRYNQSGENFLPLNGTTFFDGLAIFPTFGVVLGL